MIANTAQQGYIMKERSTKEIDTNIQFMTGFVKNRAKVINWREINGILVVGESGSSKTNTLAFIAAQLAAKGIMLVRIDYLANGDTGQTFLEQTDHLSSADYLPPATEAKDIIQRIQTVYNLGQKRRTVEKNHFPICVIFDEFSSFSAQVLPSKVKTISKIQLSEYEQEITERRKLTYMNQLCDMIVTLRKTNIKFIISGQRWSQSGTTSDLARFRKSFNTVIFHKLTGKDIGLFTESNPELRKCIEQLIPGQAYYNNRVVSVPYMPNYPKFNTRAVDMIHEYPKIIRQQLSDEEFLKTCLFSDYFTAIHSQTKFTSIYSALERAEIVNKYLEIHRKNSENVLPINSINISLQEIITCIQAGQSNYQIMKNVLHIKSGKKYQLASRALDKIRKEVHEKSNGSVSNQKHHE